MRFLSLSAVIAANVEMALRITILSSQSVKELKNKKAAGPDGIPAEVFKHGGHHLHRLHQFIYRAWTTGKLPQQWKDATIVTIYMYKKKEDRQVCGNSRGISLLSVAENFFARVMCLSGFSDKLSTLSYPNPSVVFAVDAAPLI